MEIRNALTEQSPTILLIGQEKIYNKKCIVFFLSFQTESKIFFINLRNQK